MPALVLGPIVRYVDAEVATIWLQADAACEVEILGVRERSWCVEGLHFALVTIAGLAPGADHAYEVRLDGERVWPEEGSPFPAEHDSPAERGTPTSGSSSGPAGSPFPMSRPTSCARTSIPRGTASTRCAPTPCERHGEGGAACLPDMLLMLGDQIYADEPSPALQEAIRARRRPTDTPDDEVADFGEYALAYLEAWNEPAIRWLLSTVPTTMVFDDHEIHAEWRISQGWMDEMTAKPWFHRHICAGLMAYWVFQHLGNLAPADLEGSDLYRAVRAADDGAAALARQMDNAGRQIGHSRWSFARQIGEARLVVIDSRAGRRRHAGATGARSGRGVGVDRSSGPATGPAPPAGQLGPVPARAGPASRRGVGRGGDRRSVGPADDEDRRAPASSCRDGPLGVVSALDETDLRVG